MKYLVKHKRVAVDGAVVTSSSQKADPEASVITIDVDKNKEKLQDLIYNKSAAEIRAEQSK